MKNAFVAAGLLALATSGMAVAGEVQAKIEVGGLFCPSCGYIAGEAMQSVESVKVVDYLQGRSYDIAIFVVSYDDSKANPTQIAQAVLNYGYQANVLEAPGS